MPAAAKAPPEAPAAEAPLTERSAASLARSIRAGEVTSREVVDAHIALIERRNGALNAVVAERFEAARAEADAADERVRKAGRRTKLPPFLGVPVTIKESFAVEGMPNCSGLVARAELRASEHATAVARLVEAGAIVLGVTNTSELTMWIESSNRVYGRTHNAYARRRTAGGSSGGEGASIGAGFAPLGLGTDFGGSIRLPAFFNGVFGHKPTGCLVPHTGHFPDPNERGTGMLGIGPLARRAEDLMPVLKAIAGPDGRDPWVREVELGDPADVSLEGLEVTLSDDASILPVSLELRNARVRAARALAERGARVRRISLSSARTAIEPYLAAAKQSGTLAEILEANGAAAPIGRLLATAARGRSPHTLPTLMTLTMERLAERMPDRMWARAERAERLLREEVAEAIGDGVLLHPPFGRVAPRHGATVGRPWVLAPMALFNLLGLPVTQVPLGLGKKGLPLGVQVAAGENRDHVAIAVAIELERVFGGWVPPTRPR